MDSKPLMNDKQYNVVKRMVQVVIPATSSLYFGLAQIWDFPNPEAVVGTLAVITTFLGVLIGYTSKQYNDSGAAFDGEMFVTRSEEDKTIYTLNLDGDPADLLDKKIVSFKVISSE